MFGFSIYPEDRETLMDEWGYLLNGFGVPFWVRGETYLKNARKDKQPGLPVVMITSERGEIKGEISLADFKHPKKCIYWFGGTDRINTEIPENIIARVYIPADEMMAPTAGAIVLWDRLNGKSNHRR